MCCGGESKRAIRSTSSTKSAAKQNAKQEAKIVRKIRQRPSQIPIQRQYAIPRSACPKCGRPTMLVHIAGRERQQCTNIDCRFVIQ